MLFTGTQYKMERFGYILSMSPSSEPRMLVEITKGGMDMLHRIMNDADAETLREEFEDAADEAALDAWYSAMLGAVDPTAIP